MSTTPTATPAGLLRAARDQTSLARAGPWSPCRMSGPHPSSRPSGHTDDAGHDETARPETGFPEPPGKDPGDVSRASTPRSNTPIGEPDPTEWPDPYDRREGPRAPADAMVFAGDGRGHTPTGATTTSEPHHDDDIEAPDANAPDVIDD